MKGYLIGIDGEHGVREANGLADYYNLLKCDIIDIPSRQIGGQYYNIICDDEGLLKDGYKISAVNNEREVMLVGNILVCGSTDRNGNMTSITDADVENIESNIHRVSALGQAMGLGALVLICDY